MNNMNDDKVNQNLSIKISGTTKFFKGFLLTILLIYAIFFNVLGLTYGADVFQILLVYSFYMHFMLFPFLIYSLGGIVMLVQNDHNYIEIKALFFKGCMILMIVGLVVTITSEIAHQYGYLDTRFDFNWR